MDAAVNRSYETTLRVFKEPPDPFWRNVSMQTAGGRLERLLLYSVAGKIRDNA